MIMKAILGILIGLVVLAGVYFTLKTPKAVNKRQFPAGSTGSSSPSSLPPQGQSTTGGNYQPYTFAYIGCSNTHDTIYGYHQVSSKHLFWPFTMKNGGNYSIESHLVFDWADPNNGIWHQFDKMKREYNGGDDPPVIWVQMCEILDPRERRGYHVTTFGDVQTMLANLRQHAPRSKVYISPLQSYDPPTLCKKMGPDGEEIAQMTDLANQAVAAGLALPGPGAGSNPNLGPLTAQTVASDGCHPGGYPHDGSGGDTLLGGQLANFFDYLP